MGRLRHLNIDNKGNKYLGKNLKEVDLSDVAKTDLIHRMKRVEKMYENMSYLDKVYQLTENKELNGEHEWEHIRYRLETIYEELQGEWVQDLEDGYNPVTELSELFEAFVYQVLTKYTKLKGIQYEPRIRVPGGIITPDFLVNKNRIVEVKITQKGAFKNKSKYKKVDSKMVKVYLRGDKEKFDFGIGGDCNILSLIKYIEKETGEKLVEERVILEDIKKGSDYFYKVSIVYLEKGYRSKVKFKVGVLRAKIKTILTKIGN